MTTLSSRARVLIGAITLTLILTGVGVSSATAQKSIYDRHWFTIDSTSVSVQPLKRDSKSKVTITVRYRSDKTPAAYHSTPWATIHSSGKKQASDWEAVDLTYVSKGVLRGSVYIDNDSTVGKWWVTNLNIFPLWEKNKDGTYADGVYLHPEWVKTFYVKRFTKLTVDAGPEPVKKGQPLTVKGKLTKLDRGETFDHTDAQYVNYANRAVKYYFDPSGSAGPKYMGKSVTSNAGNYQKSFTATGNGRWYVKVDATQYFIGATSDLDFVEVRK